MGEFETVRRIHWLPLLLALLSGCAAVGPDYTGTPAPAIGPDYRSSPAAFEDGIPARPESDPVAWWGSFSDPTLDRLIEVGLSQNLDVIQAAERICESRARVQLNGGRLAPDVDAINGYQYRKQSVNAEPFVGPNGTPFSQLAAGFDSRWEIDLFGRLERSIQAAEYELDARNADLADIQHTLAAEIASTYVSLRGRQEQIALVQQAIDLLRVTQQLVEQRIEQGKASELDRQQTISHIKRATGRIASLKKQAELETNRLALLVGEVPSPEFRAQVGIGMVPASPYLPPTGVPADLLSRRPDVRRFESLVAQQTAQIGVAEADLYPSLSILGSISVSARDISKLYQSESLAFSVGPAFRWNILHFQRICQNIAIEQSQLRQAIMDYQRSVMTAVGEVEDCLVKYYGIEAERASLDQARVADMKAVELCLDRFRAGKANFHRVVETQQQMLDDSQACLGLRVESLQQLIRLYKAAGGGWPGPTEHLAISTQNPVASQPTTTLLEPVSPTKRPAERIPNVDGDDYFKVDLDQDSDNPNRDAPEADPDGSSILDQGSRDSEQRWEAQQRQMILGRHSDESTGSVASAGYEVSARDGGYPLGQGRGEAQQIPTMFQAQPAMSTPSQAPAKFVNQQQPRIGTSTESGAERTTPAPRSIWASPFAEKRQD